MSTKSSNRDKKGADAPKATKIKVPSNNLFEDLKASYADIMAALLTYSGIIQRAEDNPETKARVKDKSQFNNNLQCLLADIVYLRDAAKAVFNKHKHLSGNAAPEQITWGFGLLEQYAKIAIRNEEATYKIAIELVAALDEAERELTGELKKLREANPELAVLADKELEAEDAAVQAVYETQQEQNPNVVSDVTFVESESKTVH